MENLPADSPLIISIGLAFIYAQSADDMPVFIALDKIETYQPIYKDR